MWSRFQQWIVSRWLVSSDIKIVQKENGFTNIQVKHPKYGFLVVHPTEEQAVADRENGFRPFFGYSKNIAKGDNLKCQ